MKTSVELNELATALSIAQGKIQNPSKDSSNPFFKSKYADLATVLESVRPVFSEHDLSVVQMPFNDGSNLGVTTRLMHKSGQWLEDSVSLPLQVKKNMAQEAGAVVTYLRRYALAALAGIYQDDPDGNIGHHKSDNNAQVQSLSAHEDLSKWKESLTSASTIEELQQSFMSIPANVKPQMIACKDEMKGKLSASH